MRVALLIENMYQEAEALVPFYRMQEAGFQVDLIGPQEKAYTSKHGYPLGAHRAASDIRPEDYDAVIIPGGFAPDYMRRNQAMVTFVREMMVQGKVVAAICHGPQMLIEADVLHGKHCTSFHSIRKDVENGGGKWEDSPTVVDGNLVTARTPDDLPQFCKAIVELLKGEV